MNRFAKYGLVCMLVLGIFALAGCGSSTTSSSAEKVLKVGSDITYAPFEYVNSNNQNTGFDMDLVRAIGRAAGFDKVEIENISWDGLVPAVNEGKIDAVISAMTITPDRAKSVLFSDRYFQATQYIAVKQGSSIKTAQDLVGKRVGVQANTTGQYACQKLGVSDNNLKKFDTMPDAFNALKIGQVDAAVGDSGTVMWFIKQNPDANVVRIKGDFPKEYYGMAVKLGNTALIDKLNAGLKQVIASGEYNTIYEKYFNEPAPKF